MVIDEYADIDPRAWPEVLRATLADREGWCVFVGTPKGHNDFWRLHEHARTDPAWFSLELKASKTGLIPQAELDDMRRAMSADQYDQELEVGFDAAIRGAIYRTELAAADDASAHLLRSVRSGSARVDRVGFGGWAIRPPSGFSRSHAMACG